MTILLYGALLSLFITLLVIVLASLIALRATQDRENTSPFECGFDPNGSARLPFSLRFFLLAVIFLIFDLEIVLLLPCPIIINFSLISNSLLALLLFLLILIIGLAHEWREGSLNWAV